MNKMRTVLIVVLLILPGAWNVAAQETCKRQVETQGGFSICIPYGWTVKVQEGQKYKALFAPAAEQFTPNINFKDDTDSRSLDDYATVSVKYILDHIKETVGVTDVNLLSQDHFVTALEMSGIRVVFRSEYKGMVIRTMQCYFSGSPNQKFILTGTALDKDHEVIDPIFESAARSFRFEK
jgi:hypothetical protein